MTVLRSREVPFIKPHQPKTLKNQLSGIIEPATPARTQEPNAVRLSPPDPSVGNGSGSSVPIAGRRRSLRLVAKSDSSGGAEVEDESGSRVLNNGLIENGVRALGGNVGSSRIRKRRLNVDDDGSVFGLEDGESKGFLSLRSGKKVVKRVLENGAGGEREVEKRRNGGPVIADEMLEDSVRIKAGNMTKGKTVVMEMNEASEIGEENGVVEPVEGGLIENGKLDDDTDVSLDNYMKGKVESKKVPIDLSEEGDIIEKLVKNGKPNVDWEVKKSGKRVSEDASGEGGTCEVLEKNKGFDERSSSRGRRRLTREEKGKGILVEDVPLFDHEEKGEVIVQMEVNSTSVSHTIESEENLVTEVEHRKEEEKNKQRNGSRSEQFRDIARQNASRFAHFNAEEEEDDDLSDGEAEKEVEDWPGPFSTAMKIIQDREDKMNSNIVTSVSNKQETVPLRWVPKRDWGDFPLKKVVPSLQELCMKLLVKNADAITSLEFVPDAFRHKLCQMLCDSRRINIHVLFLLVRGSPTEIRLGDCSWLTEEQFTECFKQCDTSNLSVLQLDQCGVCLPDYILLSALARSPNGMPVLSTLSLSGAYRLSDIGLRALVSAAPSLSSINLSQCSLLTSSSIDTLADSFASVLKELYINECQSIDAMLILPALKKLKNLEVLSLAGIQTVRDRFIREFVSTQGHNIKELFLTDCVKLTDSSMKIIAESCPLLHVLDLVNLCKLTDSALGYLANGCRAMQKLKLCRNAFSDEAVAAYLETAGESLKELSLNNVKKVGHKTALSLAKRSRMLHSLDLSWCRNLTDDALGLIVDSCLSLRLLKIFGCTQITNKFMDGHSNPNVQIIGVKMSPLLDNLKITHPLEAA